MDTLYNEYMDEKFPRNIKHPLVKFVGQRYIKLVRDNSVFGFIDKTNGDVLFPRSWRSPDRKNPRGNLFSEQGGMEAISQNLNGATIHPHIKYLR